MGVGIAVSLVVVLLFILASSQIMEYDLVDTLAGAVYAFILALIISFAGVPRLAATIRKKREARV